MIALVEPPSASSTRNAFSTDLALTRRSGVSVEPIRRTAAAPVASAARRAAGGGGGGAPPTAGGGAAREKICQGPPTSPPGGGAGPTPAQAPAVTASRPSTCEISSLSTSPAR